MIRKKIAIYKKYVCNSDQKNFDLFANHKIVTTVIISTINLDFLLVKII